MKKEILDAIKNGESREISSKKLPIRTYVYVRSGDKIIRNWHGPDGQLFDEKFICRIVDGKPALTGIALISAQKATANLANIYIKSGMPKGESIAKAISNQECFVQWGDVEKYIGENN